MRLFTICVICQLCWGYIANKQNGKSQAVNRVFSKNLSDINRFVPDTNDTIMGIHFLDGATKNDGNNESESTSFDASLFCKNVKEHCSVDGEDQGKHVACDNVKIVHTKVQNIGKQGNESIKITDKLKDSIINAHNYWRNVLACGTASINNLLNESFAPAAKMNLLYWSEHLSDTAQFLANKCIEAHDECRNTDVYKYVGQNLGSINESVGSVENAIGEIIQHWFDGYFNTPIGTVEKLSLNRASYLDFKTEPVSYAFDNSPFIMMAVGDLSKVGCGMTTCTGENDAKKVYLVCNYNKNFVKSFGEPLYEKGKSGGESCSSKNPKYCCLCGDFKGKESTEKYTCEGTDKFKQLQLKTPLNGSQSLKTLSIAFLLIFLNFN